MSERLEQASAIAREAGALQRERFAEPRVIETKSSAIDLVTDVDHASDALIVERISNRLQIDDLPPLIEDRAKGEIPEQWLDSQRAKTVLGWAPTFDFDRGLAKTIDWYREFLGR